MKTLITRGHIVTASDNYHADLFIDQGTVVQIGKDLSALASAADEVIDAQGLLIFPGGIDVHTHLDMPYGGTTSSDDFLTGTRAGGGGGGGGGAPARRGGGGGGRGGGGGGCCW
jgi:dihydropyrimidinase